MNALISSSIKKMTHILRPVSLFIHGGDFRTDTHRKGHRREAPPSAPKHSPCVLPWSERYQQCLLRVRRGVAFAIKRPSFGNGFSLPLCCNDVSRATTDVARSIRMEILAGRKRNCYRIRAEECFTGARRRHGRFTVGRSQKYHPLSRCPVAEIGERAKVLRVADGGGCASAACAMGISRSSTFDACTCPMPLFAFTASVAMRWRIYGYIYCGNNESFLYPPDIGCKTRYSMSGMPIRSAATRIPPEPGCPQGEPRQFAQFLQLISGAEQMNNVAWDDRFSRYMPAAITNNYAYLSMLMK